MRLHSHRAELPLPEKPPPGVTAEAWEAVRSPIEARRAEVAAEWERMALEREKEVRRLAWYQEKHNISSNFVSSGMARRGKNERVQEAAGRGTAGAG